jgi:hypothetical protein
MQSQGRYFLEVPEFKKLSEKLKFKNLIRFKSGKRNNLTGEVDKSKRPLIYAIFQKLRTTF